MPNKSTVRFSGRKRVIAVAIASCFASAPAWGNPSAPQVVSGNASFSQAGKLLTVNNSNGAIINWNSFSIAADESTRFNQPTAASSVLNRVIAKDPSVLLGSLSSNGKVWLVNPAGILVGQGAKIDVAGFVASTLNVRNEDFLAGRLSFGATPEAGSVRNAGRISTPSGGSVYLIAPEVENRGIIQASDGEVILAAGQKVELADTGTPGVKVEITGERGEATNLGEIVAEAGRIGMAGVLVKNSGTLNASSVVKEGGRIFLRASQDAYVDGAGRIVTTGKKGGSIEVLGKRVAVTDQAQLDASGASAGGTVLAGGDYQGKNPEVQNASVTYFGPQASIKADAGVKGDGGKVIVWSDDTTRAYGSISARGGAEGGDGGFVETSGAYLEASGKVDTRAPQGKTGKWLLDPQNLEVASYGGSVYDPGTNNMFANNEGGTTVITPASINASSSNVVLQASTDLSFTDSVSMSYGGASLTAVAGRSILVNNDIATNNGDISLYANDESATGTRTAGAGGVIQTIGTSINAGAGMVLLRVGAGAGGGQQSGDIVAGNITAQNVELQQNGTTDGSSNILRASADSLITARNVLLEVDHSGAPANGSVGTSSAPIRVAPYGGSTLNLESHTHEASPGIFIEAPNPGTNLITGDVPFFSGGVNGVQTVTSGSIEIKASGTGSTITTSVYGGAAACGFGAGGLAGGPICAAGAGDYIMLGATGSLVLNSSVAASDVTLAANSMSINDPAMVSASGTAVLKPYSYNPIDLGAAPSCGSPPCVSSSLLLTAADLGRVSATTLVVGDESASGPIFINAPVDLSANVGTLALKSDGGINQDLGSPVTVSKLALVAGGRVKMQADNRVSTLAGVASGDFLFTNAQSLAIGSVAGYDGLSVGHNFLIDGGEGANINVKVNGGSLTVDQPTNADANGGCCESAAASVSLSATGITIDGNSGYGGTISAVGQDLYDGGSATVVLNSYGGAIALNDQASITAYGGRGTDSSGYATFDSDCSCYVYYGGRGGDAKIELNAGSGQISLNGGSSILATGGNSDYNKGGDAEIRLITTGSAGVLLQQGSWIGAYGGYGLGHGDYSDLDNDIGGLYISNGGAATVKIDGGSGPIVLDDATIVATGGDAEESYLCDGYCGAGSGGSAAVALLTTGTASVGSDQGIVLRNNAYIKARGGYGAGIYSFYDATDAVDFPGAGGNASITLDAGAGPLLLDSDSYNYLGTPALYAQGGNSDAFDGGSANIWLKTTSGSISLANASSVEADGGEGGGFTSYYDILRDEFFYFGTGGEAKVKLTTDSGGINLTGASWVQAYGGRGDGEASYFDDANNAYVYSGNGGKARIKLDGGTGPISLTDSSLYASGGYSNALNGGSAKIKLLSSANISLSNSVVEAHGGLGSSYASYYIFDQFNNDLLSLGDGGLAKIKLSAGTGLAVYGGSAISAIGGEGRGSDSFIDGTENSIQSGYGGRGEITLDGGAGTILLDTASTMDAVGGYSIYRDGGDAETALSATGNIALQGASSINAYGGACGGECAYGAATVDVSTSTGNVTLGGNIYINNPDIHTDPLISLSAPMGAIIGADGVLSAAGYDVNLALLALKGIGQPGNPVRISAGFETISLCNGSDAACAGAIGGAAGNIVISQVSGDVLIDTNVDRVVNWAINGGYDVTAENGNLRLTGGSMTANGSGNLGLHALGLDKTLTIDPGATLVTAGGEITLQADQFVLSGEAASVNAGASGTVALQPGTAGLAVAIGGTQTPGVSSGSGRIDDNALGSISAGTLRIGSMYGGSIDFGSGGPVLAGGALPFGTLSLITQANITQSVPVLVSKLAFESGGSVVLDDANLVGTLAGSAVGDILVTNAQSLALGLVDGVTGITSTAGADLVLAVPAFSNSAGAAALSAPSGRWLVYSADPASNSIGALSYDFKHYGLSFASDFPYTGPGSGNGLIYSLAAPAVSVALTGTVSKVYDRTTTATLAPANYAVSGTIAGDTLNFSSQPTAGTYADWNAGTGKMVSTTVAYSGFSNGPVAVYGYTLPSTTVSGDVGVITPKTLTASGIIADSKVYDGNATAVVNTASATVTALAGDDVSLAVSGASGSFADKNVGSNKSVTVSGLSLVGADVANYLIGSSGASADITAAPLSLSGITVASKVYDGNTDANISGGSMVGAISGDDLNFSGSASFVDKKVGTAKPVSVTGLALGGADAGNYALSNGTASASADITPASLTLSGLTAQNKVYDASTKATLAGTAQFTGVVSGDDVSLGGSASAQFGDKNVGKSKVVTVSGITLAGADAGNYVLADTGGSTTADITPASLTLSGLTAKNKVYDSTTKATLTGTAVFTGVMPGDTVTLGEDASASFADKNVGEAKKVSVSGLTLAGTDGGNYVLANTSADTSADITPASLTLDTLTVKTKTYDGKTLAPVDGGSFTGLFAGDAVTLAGSGTYADKNVGQAKPVTVDLSKLVLEGDDALNYKLGGTAPAAVTGDITVRAQANWTAAGGGNWSDPANWDALPDLSNVQNASVPAGVSVTYDAAAGNTNLLSLTAGGLNLAGGSLNISDSLTLSSSFAQSGGTLALGGGATASITQAGGNLAVPGLSLANLNLSAPAGAITQGGALVVASLSTDSQSGTTLTDAGNRIGSFGARNSGSGNVTLTNTGALTITGILNTAGGIVVDNTGAVSTVGQVIASSGPVTIMGHSPVTIGAGGVSAGGSIVLSAGQTAGAGDTLLLDGPVASSGSGAISLSAGDDLVQNSSVSAGGGAVSASSETGNISMGLGASTSSGGGSISYAASSGNVVLTSLNAGDGAIALTAGKSIETASGYSGANLVAGKAMVVAGANATLSTQVKQLDVTVQGSFSITDAQSGVSITDAPAGGTAPVLEQVVSTVNNSTKTDTTQTQSQTQTPGTTTPTTGTGTQTSGNTTQTIGGSEGSFGGGSGEDGNKSTTNQHTGSATGGDNSGSGKQEEAKSDSGKKEEGKSDSGKTDQAKSDDKKDDKKDEDKKKEEESTAKKDEGKPVKKKLATCS